MKKLLIGLAALVVLIVVALLAAPFVIPMETYRERIAQAARDATGRALTIRGDFRVSILPRLELEADDVAFANAAGSSDPDMATLRKLLVQLQVWPLVSGEVKIDSFVLIDPVIHLEVDKSGRANWDFATAAPAAGGAEGAGGAGGPGLQQLSLGDVRLENGLLTFRDARSGQAFEISDINMTLSVPDLDGPVGAQGSVVWNGKTLQLSAKSEGLRRLLAGATTPVGLTLESEPVKLGYQGSMTKAGGWGIDGEVALEVPSLRDLAAWTGNPIEAGGTGFGPLKVKGKVAATGTGFTVTNATIALDEMNAEGDLVVAIGGAKPVLKGRVAVDEIDLNAYLPPQDEDKPGAPGTPGAPAAPAGANGQAAWSDDPIELDGLKAVNAEFELSVGGIRVQDLKIGKSVLKVSLKDGLLDVDLGEINLYGGSGTGRLRLDARGAVPAMAKSFTIEGVQAEPLLSDAAGFDRLAGTGQFNIAVSATGRSQREMVQALVGTGALKFVDGAIKGVNLAAMVRNVGSAFLDKSTRETQKTDFAELTGTFRIDKGILRNDDLLLIGPLLRLTGAGTADVPRRTVNYRMEPKVVGTLEGQGGAAGATGVTVPVIVEGPWHDLRYRPDLAGLATGIAKDPTKALEGAKGTLKQLREGATGGLGQVLEGVTKQPAEGDQGPGGGLIPDPGSTLKKLFGD